MSRSSSSRVARNRVTSASARQERRTRLWARGRLPLQLGRQCTDDPPSSSDWSLPHSPKAGTVGIRGCRRPCRRLGRLVEIAAGRLARTPVSVHTDSHEFSCLIPSVNHSFVATSDSRSALPTFTAQRGAAPDGGSEPRSQGRSDTTRLNRCASDPTRRL